MSESGSLRSCDVRAILQLVGECRELGDDGVVWRAHLIETLGHLVDADLGSAGEMQGCRSLAVRDLGVIHWVRGGLINPALIDAAMIEFRRDPACAPTILEYLRRNPLEGGLCLMRKELLDDRAWYASRDYQLIQQSCGLDHILWCFRPISEAETDENSGIILTRAAGKRNFSARDRLLVREVHAVLAPLIGGPLRRFRDPSPRDLAPRARQVLACLLEGDGDKQVASRLALSVHTVNQYTKHIFRHFGVQSRAELLALWLRRHAHRGFPWTGP
jgi:DNA-binding CsgD family transcriptional regulator